MSDSDPKEVSSPPLRGRNPRAIRIVMTGAGLAGLSLAIVLLLHSGIHDVVHILDRAGWTLLWLIPLRAVPIALDATGWRALLRDHRRATPLFLTWAAAVRDSVNGLLPVARVGGEVVGLRLLMIRGVPGTDAAASVIVEVTVTLLVQFLFTVLGLAILLYYLRDSGVARDVAFGLAASVPALVIFFLLQHRWGLFQLLDRVLVALTGNKSLSSIGDPARLDQSIQTLYQQPRVLAVTGLWQLAGLIAGAGELWVTLYLLGYPTSLVAVLLLESLAQAVQSASFFVPAGLGIQEGSFVLFGAAIGLAPDVALALSLARRMRQIGFGLPVLVSWHWMEGRHLRRLIQGHGSEKHNERPSL